MPRASYHQFSRLGPHESRLISRERWLPPREGVSSALALFKHTPAHSKSARVSPRALAFPYRQPLASRVLVPCELSASARQLNGRPIAGVREFGSSPTIGDARNFQDTTSGPPLRARFRTQQLKRKCNDETSLAAITRRPQFDISLKLVGLCF